MAGWAGLSVPTFLPEVLPAVEVGWRLGADFRGRGLATEAGGAALRWGFEDLGLREIVSIHEPDNAASGRVMDRLRSAPGTATVDPARHLPARRAAPVRRRVARPDGSRNRPGVPLGEDERRGPARGSRTSSRPAATG